MKIQHVTTTTINDISELVSNFSLSGSKGQAARKLQISVLNTEMDVNLPKVNINCGEAIIITTDEGEEVFSGYVFSRSFSKQDETAEYTAYDGLIYLTKSEISRNFQNITAEEITKNICKEFGIQTGSIKNTGHKQSFIVIGKTAYQTIMIAYTTASKITGKKYIPIMLNGKLNVVESGAYTSKHELDSRVDIISPNYSETIEDMINKVVVVDSTGNKVAEYSNKEDIQKYGLLQKIYKQENESEDIFSQVTNSGTNEKEAKSLLKEIEREASIEALGKLDCITGNSVKVRDPGTNLIGLFYIDSDTHSWNNGVYKMGLGLNFKNTMTEIEVEESKTKKDKGNIFEDDYGEYEGAITKW